MSNFGAKLAELLERNEMRAVDLARICGLSEAMLSKWINGQQRFVSTEDLAQLCNGISTDTKERAELIKAHLLDELGSPPAPGSELIHITIKGGGHTTFQESAGGRPVFPLHIQRALDLIGSNAVTDADVRAMLIGMAGILSPQPDQINDASSDPRLAAAESAVAKIVETSYGKSAKSKRASKKPSK